MRLLAEQTPSAYVRSMLDDDAGDPGGTGITDDLWRKLVDLGWVGLLVPEELGGSGAVVVAVPTLGCSTWTWHATHLLHHHAWTHLGG